MENGRSPRGKQTIKKKKRGVPEISQIDSLHLRPEIGPAEKSKVEGDKVDGPRGLVELKRLDSFEKENKPGGDAVKW